MRIILIFGAIVLFLVPAALGIARRYLRKGSEAHQKKRARKAMDADNVYGISPEPKALRLYPAIIQESTVPRRVLSEDSKLETRLTAGQIPQEPSPRLRGLGKLRALPPLKRAIVWADILSSPKALREDDFYT